LTVEPPADLRSSTQVPPRWIPVDDPLVVTGAAPPRPLAVAPLVVPYRDAQICCVSGHPPT
jgi:hypothetical protein